MTGLTNNNNTAQKNICDQLLEELVFTLHEIKICPVLEGNVDIDNKVDNLNLPESFTFFGCFELVLLKVYKNLFTFLHRSPR